MQKPDAPRTRVLVVDDEVAMREVLRDEFEALHCEVLEASDGNSALETLGKETVDLVLSDVRMPRCSGIELLQAIRANMGLNPPMVLMSGYSDISAWDVFHYGANGWCGKPFNFDVVPVLLQAHVTSTSTRWTTAPAEAAKVDLPSRPGTPVALGRGGMFVGLATLAGLTPGTLVNFRVDVPGTAASSLEGIGLVRWIRSRLDVSLTAGCGIEFVYLTPESQRVVAADEAQRATPFIPRGL